MLNDKSNGLKKKMTHFFIKKYGSKINEPKTAHKNYKLVPLL